MKAVLGLSVTPHGIAWALVDGGDTGDDTQLDDDAFEVEVADQVAARAAAAARSARAIAAASGQDVTAIGVTATGFDPDDDQLAQLLDRLAATGFDDVRIAPELDPPDRDERGLEAQLCDAHAAAHAVASGRGRPGSGARRAEPRPGA
ncbi:hypothetical protein H7H51_01810, partial [Mycolicibacterium farcinogenes]|nr:hypothetical protein [Mycolicibacterium farcinogenes]